MGEEEEERAGQGGGKKAGACSFSAAKRSSGCDAPKRVRVKSAGNQNNQLFIVVIIRINIKKTEISVNGFHLFSQLV